MEFDTYRLDPVQGLRDDGRDVHLTPKALTLLHFLASRAGEVVTKSEIFSAVWPQTYVSEAALSTCIRELRRALNDDAYRPRYIETRHGHGYRFVREVTAEPVTYPDRVGLVNPWQQPSWVATRDLALAHFHLQRALALFQSEGGAISREVSEVPRDS